MSSAETLVADAFNLLGVTDIAEIAPSPAEMEKGLRALNQMIDAWATQGLNVVERTYTGTFTSGEKTVTLDLAETGRLAPGMNVTATGLSTRIRSIDSPTQITLEAAATLNGSSASIVFAALPFEAKHEEGVTALLALRLAPRSRVTDIPAMVVQLASDGWITLQAQFMPIPAAQFDAMLIGMSNTTRQAAYYDGSDG